MTHQVAAHTDQVWEADLKLLSSRMIGQWSLVLIITFLVMSLILGIALVVNDGWHAVAGVLPVLAAIVAGLWLLGLLIMAVVFRGRYSVRYTINGEGIRMETLSGVAKAANRGLILLGLISGKPGPVGTGLIGMSQETQSVKWRGAFRAITDPAHHGISLRGAWRTLMWVQCTAENYAEVTARITTETSAHASSSRVATTTPLRGYLLRTGMVVLASLPIFALTKEHDLNLLITLVMFCFALATVWLIPLFGWVILICLALLCANLVGSLIERRNSFFTPGETYLRYQVLSTDDWALIAIAGICMVWLAWFSMGAIRGRTPSALMSDFRDKGEA